MSRIPLALIGESDNVLGKVRATDHLDPDTQRTCEGFVIGLFLGAVCWGVLIGIGFWVFG